MKIRSKAKNILTHITVEENSSSTAELNEPLNKIYTDDFLGQVAQKYNIRVFTIKICHQEKHFKK